MCQYSAEDGSATAWHRVHLGQMAQSGAGLLFIEATAVEAIGRITPGCTGLYSGENERALGAVLDDIRIQRCRLLNLMPVQTLLSSRADKMR